MRSSTFSAWAGARKIRRSASGVPCSFQTVAINAPSAVLADSDRIQAGLNAHEWLSTDDRDLTRALDVQRQLTALGKHRTVPLPDLLIAAIAERHQVTALHYDADFDLIATVTTQPTQWVVPRGSLT